jgi:hypothetical protein
MIVIPDIESKAFFTSTGFKYIAEQAKGAERVGVQLPRARWEKLSKYERSRARSGQLQRRVRPPHQCGSINAL